MGLAERVEERGHGFFSELVGHRYWSKIGVIQELSRFLLVQSFSFLLPPGFCK